MEAVRMVFKENMYKKRIERLNKKIDKLQKDRQSCISALEGVDKEQVIPCLVCMKPFDLSKSELKERVCSLGCALKLLFRRTSLNNKLIKEFDNELRR
jgi:hypothetical protein